MTWDILLRHTGDVYILDVETTNPLWWVSTLTVAYNRETKEVLW